MSDHTAPMRSMMRYAFTAVFFLLALAGCAKKQDDGEKGRPASDSTHVADSSAQTPVSAPAKLLSYEESQGALLYGQYCAVCHGEDGKGDGFNAFNLDPRPRDFSDSTYMRALSDDQIVQTIGGGGRSVNKSPLMPSYGWTFSRQQIRYLVSYVRSFTDQVLPAR